MADQEYCGGGPNWWDSSSSTAASRSRFDGGSSTSSSSTTTTLANGGGACGYGWLTDSPMAADINATTTRSSLDTKMDASALQLVGLGLSSQQGLDWNHHPHHHQEPPLLRNTEKSDNSFRAMLQEGMGFQQHENSGVFGSQLEYSSSELKQRGLNFSVENNNQTEFSQSCSSMESTVYGSPPSTILQGFIGSDQPQLNYHNHNNYMGLDNQQWAKVPQFLRSSPTHFSNNTAPYFNADVRPSLLPPQLPVPLFQDKPSKDTSSGTGKNNNNNNNNKRGRNETATSTLPPFKVRKEKMGDRITALQQLVSPFGKTDTASVLSEAIEYIKFLHEQVSVLSTPYLKGGAPSYQQHQQVGEKTKVDPERESGAGQGQDLRSRGLCLVPVSSTFPVTHETTVDFWTPTFGGTFR